MSLSTRSPSTLHFIKISNIPKSSIEGAGNLFTEEPQDLSAELNLLSAHIPVSSDGQILNVLKMSDFDFLSKLRIGIVLCYLGI